MSKKIAIILGNRVNDDGTITNIQKERLENVTTLVNIVGKRVGTWKRIILNHLTLFLQNLYKTNIVVTLKIFMMK